MTITCGLFVRLEAKPGKEQAVADFLIAGVELTNREATTPIWFALRLSPTTFGAFDAFASEEDRNAPRPGCRVSTKCWQGRPQSSLSTFWE